MVAQPAGVPLLERCAVEHDGTAIGMIELVEQVDDGALACSAETHQCRYLAGLNRHRHVVQGLDTIGIGKVYMLQFEATLYLIRAVVARILHLFLAFQQLKESLGVDQRIVQVVVDTV